MDTKKLKNFLPYLIIPVVIIGLAFYFVTSSTESTKAKYYEVVAKFHLCIRGRQSFFFMLSYK